MFDEDPLLTGEFPTEDVDIVEYMHRLYQRSRDHFADANELGSESYDYYNNKPYTEDEERKMEDKNIPRLRINRVYPEVRDKKAMALRGLPEIKVYPRITAGQEGMEDAEKANPMNELVRFVQQENDMLAIQNKVNQDAIITGKGWAKCIFQDDVDDDISDIQIMKRNYNVVFPDPDSEEEDLIDAEYVIEARRMSLSRLLRMFSGKKDLIGPDSGFDANWTGKSSSDTGDYDEDKKSKDDEDSVLLLECWVKEHTKGIVVFDPGDDEEERPAQYVVLSVDDDGDPVPPVGKDKVEFVEWLATTKPVKKLRYVIRLVHVAGNVLLNDTISPYAHGMFPFVPLYCNVSNDGGSQYVFGEVENAKEPQKLHNKFFSLALKNLAAAANFLWLMKKGILKKEHLENAGPGAVIEIDTPGPIGDAIKRVTSVPMISEMVRIMELLKYEIDRMFGVFPPQRGEQTGATKSGKHQELLMEQGQVSVEELSRNASGFRKQLGKLIVSNIQQFWQGRDIVQIVGPDGARKLINVRESFEELGTMKFDVVISDTRGMPTTNTEIFEMALMLHERGAIDNEELLEVSPYPNKEKALQRIRREKQQMMMGIPAGAGGDMNQPRPSPPGGL